jgi:hypothetical protein
MKKLLVVLAIAMVACILGACNEQEPTIAGEPTETGIVTSTSNGTDTVADDDDDNADNADGGQNPVTSSNDVKEQPLVYESGTNPEQNIAITLSSDSPTILPLAISVNFPVLKFHVDNNSGQTQLTYRELDVEIEADDVMLDDCWIESYENGTIQKNGGVVVSSRMHILLLVSPSSKESDFSLVCKASYGFSVNPDSILKASIVNFVAVDGTGKPLQIEGLPLTGNQLIAENGDRRSGTVPAGKPVLHVVEKDGFSYLADDNETLLWPLSPPQIWMDLDRMRFNVSSKVADAMGTTMWGAIYDEVHMGCGGGYHQGVGYFKMTFGPDNGKVEIPKSPYSNCSFYAVVVDGNGTIFKTEATTVYFSR